LLDVGFGSSPDERLRRLGEAEALGLLGDLNGVDELNSRLLNQCAGRAICSVAAQQLRCELRASASRRVRNGPPFTRIFV
jgi:hypothetical protein